MSRPLLEFMEQVPDPRCSRKKKHVLAEILTCLVIGYLSGRTTIRRSLKWCGNRVEWLQVHGILKNGVASPSTASRVLSGIDEVLFAAAFMEWIGAILDTKGIHIAIDGKALRGAMSRVSDTRAPIIMNALDAATGLVIAQLPVRDKSCEITALPELLDLLEIKGSIITIDAIGTQTAVMEKIVSGEGDFVLFVKGNQAEAKADIRGFFSRTEEDLLSGKSAPDGYNSYECSEKNRDRHEYRRCCASTDCIQVSRFEDDWPFLKTIGIIKQVRIPVERNAEGIDITPDKETFCREGSRRKPQPSAGDSMAADIQEVGLISSRRYSAKELLEIKRAHWMIENQLHHVLDESFREDRSPAKKSKINLSLIRKFAYNLIRIAMLQEECSTTMTEAMDDFCDDLSMIEKYVFTGIPSFY